MMRSTIVFGSVSAGLLGIAVWATLRSDPTPEELSCEALQPQIAEFHQLQTAKRAQLGSLFGPTPASLGSRLADAAIGTAATPELLDRMQWTTTPTIEQPYQVWIQDGGSTVFGIEVSVGQYDTEKCTPEDNDPCSCQFESGDRDLCDELGRRLTTMWGSPTEPVGADGATKVRGWFDRDARVRATLEGCRLHYEYVDPE